MGDKNQVKAIVTNAKGEVAEGIEVNFSADNGGLPNRESVITNVNGEALFNVANTKAGETTVTATVNNKTVKKIVTFVANSRTARIKSDDFIIIKDNQPANGTAKNRVKVIVTDAKDNVVRGAEVTFIAKDGAKPDKLSLATDDQGAALFEVANTKIGLTTVTATVNNRSVQKAVTFVADKATATIEEGNFRVIYNNQSADGHLVKDFPVEFSANNRATPDTKVITTNEKGVARFELSHTKIGEVNVTATVNGHSFEKSVTFDLGELVKVSITPRVTVLQVGESQIYDVIGEDTLGNKSSVANYATWQVYDYRKYFIGEKNRSDKLLKIIALKVGKGDFLRAIIHYKGNKTFENDLAIDVEEKTASSDDSNVLLNQDN